MSPQLEKSLELITIELNKIGVVEATLITKDEATYENIKTEISGLTVKQADHSGKSTKGVKCSMSNIVTFEFLRSRDENNNP